MLLNPEELMVQFLFVLFQVFSTSEPSCPSEGDGMEFSVNKLSHRTLTVFLRKKINTTFDKHVTRLNFPFRILVKGSLMSTHKIADFLVRKFYLQGKSTCLCKETELCQKHPLTFHGCSLKGRERQLISATDLLQAVRGQQGVEVFPITVIIFAVVIIMIMLQIH